MTIPIWCLIIASAIPLVLAWVGGYFRYRQLGHIDNKHPRSQYLQLEGAGARAIAAQQNAWEALIIFTIAVFVSHLFGADPAKADLAAQMFILARVMHALFYLANWDILRSLAFILGLGSCVWMFILSI